MQRKYLHISIAAVLIFVAILLYYVISPIYLGVFPIGIITAGCILVQIAMLFLSGKNIAVEGFQLKTIAAIGRSFDYRNGIFIYCLVDNYLKGVDFCMKKRIIFFL